MQIFLTIDLLMKSQRQRGWDVHRQLNHPVDLEMLELPRLRRKTKSLKKCLRTLWMIYLWVQMSKTVWTFFPMVITKRKRKRRRTRKKDKKEKPKNLENTRRRKKRPSHQRWQLENTRRRKKDLVIKDDNLWHASVKKIVKGKRTLSSCKLLGDAWFKFHILIICIYQLPCCCYLYRKPSISLLYWPYLGSIYQVYAMYIFMFFTKKTAPLEIRNQKNPLR